MASLTRTTQISLMFVGISLAAWTIDATAQINEFETARSGLLKAVETRARVLSSIEAKETWLLVLTIAVGAAGALTAFIQGVEIPWKRTCTAFLGLAISITTVVLTTVYPTDYRGFRAARIELEAKLDEARHLLEAFRLNADVSEQQRQIASVQKLLSEFQVIRTKILAHGLAVEIVPHASAASAAGAPEWLSQRGGPADRGNFFQFIGHGSGDEPAKARELSLENAVEQASNTLSETIDRKKLIQRTPEEVRAIRDYVRRSVAIAGTHYLGDSSTRQYQHFTLIKLDKLFFAPDVVRLIFPAASAKAVAKVEVRQRHRAAIGGEFANNLALYVGDVSGKNPFRILLYIPASRADVEQSGAMPTALARGEAKKLILDQQIDPTKGKEVDFAYDSKKYRLVFEVIERQNRTDRVVAEIFAR